MGAVRVYEELTELFKITVGLRQGCGLLPDPFILLLEAVMILALNCVNSGMILNEEISNNLRFADDIHVDLEADSPRQLQELTDSVHDSSQRFWTTNKCRLQKTKTMTIGK